MKHILLFLVLSVASLFADTQRFVYFNPPQGTLTIYREFSADFRRSATIKADSLSPDQQLIISNSLTWLQTQLALDESLLVVIFEPYYVQSELGLRAAITGQRNNGAERTIAIDSKDVPDEVRAGLVLLWNELASVPLPNPIPPPAPEPTPTPEP